ncbi:hypothetical protein X907_0505 [Glycocaulis alkaliphilus]|uniref:Uncharacterized protein n=1 Tax=Glycocaulis alkaliphilus TaxID=1434191 RepID=A0A3T0E6Q1_9PROT|nr:hypothetical protein X907_0505 [Glycocaulis alkaliphilus]
MTDHTYNAAHSATPGFAADTSPLISACLVAGRTALGKAGRNHA